MKGGESFDSRYSDAASNCSIESACATMKIFTLETQDQQAKQDFQSIAKSLDSACMTLKGIRTIY